MLHDTPTNEAVRTTKFISLVERALRWLDFGHYSPATLAQCLEEIANATDDAGAAEQFRNVRQSYLAHEQKLPGIILGSEAFHGWMVERKQVHRAMRAALARAMATCGADRVCV
jgi:hypothetical protein